MKNLMTIMGVLACCLLASCSSSAAKVGKEEKSVEGKDWHEIAPTDVKNAIQLFDKDWMALAAGEKGDMNAMTISWGSMGELWGRPVITVYVSTDRYTHSFMERNQYFTVTGFPADKKSALQVIGTRSGRDGDKFKVAGLTPEYTSLGNPIFKEANLAIECRVIYSAPFDLDRIDPDARRIYDNGMGVHTMYIGEIINVWEK